VAIGDPYISRNDLKGYLGVKAAKDMYDDDLDDVIASSTQEVERYCNRQFNKASTVSSRDYPAGNSTLLQVDDFYSVTGLIVALDTADNGTFSTVVSSSDYELFPLNGIVDGQTGWPFCRIRFAPGVLTLGGYRRRQAYVRITALWGWSAIPSPVKQATKIIAAETFQMKDAPFGVAGSDAFGNVLRVRDNKIAVGKLARYSRTRIMVG
jgi:hypothetical protein